MPRKKTQEKIIHELLSGKSPSEIAESLGITFSSVKRAIYEEIGSGRLKISDLFFSISPNSKIKEDQEILKSLEKNLDFRGEMYQYIVDIELFLHDYIGKNLADHFGEDDWFKKGVPKVIQKKCYSNMVDDNHEFDDPFCYTYFYDLGEIVSKNGKIFLSKLPKSYKSNLNKVKEDIRRINNIRNIVMHPIKRKKWDFNDFYFVKDFLEKLQEFS